jgi:hypothetical protein
MNTPFSGGCACGAVRFTCTSPPVAMLNCHCRDCQRASGAPFASGVIVRAADVAITGNPASHAVQGGSGSPTVRRFCGHCGSPLFAHSDASGGYLSIRFPALDDPSGFRPMLDIWTGSAQPWVCLDEAIPHFAGSPPGAGGDE